jgi:hypothetical protein
VLALTVVAVGIGAGGAYAATSGHDQSTPALRAASSMAFQHAAPAHAASAGTPWTATHAPLETHRAAADFTPTLTTPHDLVGAAIAKAFANRHISTTEAALADLFLEHEIKPDPALRNAWRPVVEAAADALGLPVGSLKVDLENSESLAEIAGQQGRSPAAVAQSIEVASRAALAKAVADGALSAAAGADILELQQTNMSDVLRFHP